MLVGFVGLPRLGSGRAGGIVAWRDWAWHGSCGRRNARTEVLMSNIDERFAIGGNRVLHKTRDPALGAESSIILIPPYLPLNIPKLVLCGQNKRCRTPALPILSKIKLRIDVPSCHSTSIRFDPNHAIPPIWLGLPVPICRTFVHSPY